jgi:hypothetical protein
MKTMIAAFVALVALAPAARAEGAGKKSHAKHEEATFIKSDEVRWGRAPPELPEGGQLAVLYGDPSKSAPFAIRLKAPDGYKIAPHWHSQDEQLTVISGTLMLHMGDSMESPAHALDAGSFHFLPGKMHHAAEAKGETVVQINGKGPFDIHYLNPADDPRRPSAAAKGESKRRAGRRP